MAKAELKHNDKSNYWFVFIDLGSLVWEVYFFLLLLDDFVGLWNTFLYSPFSIQLFVTLSLSLLLICHIFFSFSIDKKFSFTIFSLIKMTIFDLDGSRTLIVDNFFVLFCCGYCSFSWSSLTRRLITVIVLSSSIYLVYL